MMTSNRRTGCSQLSLVRILLLATTLTLLLVYCISQTRSGGPSVISAIETRDVSSCDDLKSCRTLLGLLWSCLTTIFLCTWGSIHPNIMFTSEIKERPRFKKWLEYCRTKLHGFFTYSLPLFLVAILVPEYILAWAIRQFFIAGRIQERYSKVSGWTRAHGFYAIMGGFHYFHLTRVGEDCAMHVKYKQKGDSVEGVTTAPLRIRDSKHELPQHPLSIQDIPTDILLALTPTESELKDRGKSDAIAKSIVVVQTLWFVIQCIARRARDLPLTEVEVVTLAYAAMNLYIYVFWWEKPQNVACPTRIYVSPSFGVTGSSVRRSERWFNKPLEYMLGAQDCLTNLRTQRQVPMFWSGMEYKDRGCLESKVFMGASVLGSAFGAIHCLSWSAEFPSNFELWLWRGSCITMMAVPLVAALVCTTTLVIVWRRKRVKSSRQEFLKRVEYGLKVLLMPCVLLYIAARIATLTLALTTLSSLPSEAFRVVDWTTFIPHI